MLKRIAVIFITLIMAFPAFGADVKKDIEVQQAFTTIQNASSEFKISVWVDHQDNTYTIGQPIKFYFKSTRDCYINLLDIGTSSKVTLIYPNQYEQSNFIKAGITYQLPRPNSFQFTASAPQGKEMIKAIATLSKTDLAMLPGAKSAGPFKRFDQEGTAVAKDIQVTLNQTPLKQWAEYQKVITIAEKPSGPMPVNVAQPVEPVAQATAVVPVAQTPPATYTALWNDGCGQINRPTMWENLYNCPLKQIVTVMSHC